MNKIMVFALGLMLGAFAVLGSAQADTGGVASLRGDYALQEDSKAPKFKKWTLDRRPYTRAYLDQPPLIPHKTEGYSINLRQNKCLTCHSWQRYKDTGATKISLTHFRNRFGTELSDVSPQRYFCNQCHAPQRDTAPLVGNDFDPVAAVKPQ